MSYNIIRRGPPLLRPVHPTDAKITRIAEKYKKSAKKRFKMTNKRIAELGKKTRFTSENQPKNSGRKPKLYNIAASGYKVSKEEFADTANYVMQLPKEEAMKLVEKADTPMWVALIIRSLYKSASKGL